jgi:CAAD domains of cyanobacterial aminoacyl-tRNA synthetase
VVRAFRDDEIKEAGKEVVDNVSTTATEFADKVAAYWEASEEKPTLVAVGFGAILALYFANTIVTAVDHLPLLSTVFELIGLTFSGWTTYRLIAVEGEKEKLISGIKGFASKVGLNL